jgi:chromosome partitioning protein
MEIISFINHKGGVGKSTLCCHFAQALAIIGQNVLIIDNDSQHSLTNSVGLTVADVTIRDYYLGKYKDPNEFLQDAVTHTSIPNLHIITSELRLANDDILDVMVLHNLFENSFINEYYDFVLIDNHPGIDKLQKTSILASTRLIVPVQLKQKSLEGLDEMMKVLEGDFAVAEDKITIIPNIVENLKAQHLMFGVLKKLFPKQLSNEIIPLDRVIEEVEREKKILFLDRLSSSKSAPYFIKLLTELFPYVASDYNGVESKLKDSRKAHRSEIARINFSHKKRK